MSYERMDTAGGVPASSKKKICICVLVVVVASVIVVFSILAALGFFAEHVDLSGKGEFWLVTTHDILDVYVFKAEPGSRESTSASLGFLGHALGAGLRSMKIDPSTGHLYIAQAASSKILRVKGACNGGNYEVFTTEGLAHPYGLDFRADVMYVSNQIGNRITTYNTTSGEMINGNLAMLDGPRSVVIDLQTDLFYSSPRNEDQVVEFRLDGTRVRTWQVARPAGLLLAPSPFGGAGNALWWGTAEGTVTAVELESGEVRQTYGPSEGLGHSSALYLRGGVLHVISQDFDSVLKFDVVTAEAKGLLRFPVPDRPEQLCFVSCK